MNEKRAQLYASVMDAQERIAKLLYRRGVSHQSVLDALDAVDEQLSEEDRREDLYVSALAAYVAKLGGRLELRAVFDGEELVVRQEPPRPAN